MEFKIDYTLRLKALTGRVRRHICLGCLCNRLLMSFGPFQKQEGIKKKNVGTVTGINLLGVALMKTFP